MLSILRQIDWKKVLKEQNVPHTEEIFKTLDNLKNIIENIEKYGRTEALQETRKEISNHGKGLWGKLKEIAE